MRINYHPGKANVIADALSRKRHCNMVVASEMSQELSKEFEKLNLGIVNATEAVTIEVESTL